MGKEPVLSWVSDHPESKPHPHLQPKVAMSLRSDLSDKRNVVHPSLNNGTADPALCHFLSQVFFPAGWNTDVMAGAELAILSKGDFGQRGDTWWIN